MSCRNTGLGQKIIADMSGMALRTYHERVRRLSESATDRGRTLWEAVLGLIQDKGSLTRAEVLQRLRREDPLVVRSVLNDLVDRGLSRCASHRARGIVPVSRESDGR